MSKYILFLFPHYGFPHFIRALAKNNSFGFLSVGFRVEKNQMCCLCGWVSMKHNVLRLGVVADF